MGKNFIHGFAGNFATEFNGPNFVAMTSPAPYAQWEAVYSAVVGAATWTSGSGFVQLTADTDYGYMYGRIDLWMVAQEGITTITATASQSGNPAFNSQGSVWTSVNGDAQTPLPLYAGDWSGYPGYPAAYPGAGNLAVPYYRYRICAELLVNAGACATGDWIRIDFSLS